MSTDPALPASSSLPGHLRHQTYSNPTKKRSSVVLSPTAAAQSEASLTNAYSSVSIGFSSASSSSLASSLSNRSIPSVAGVASAVKRSSPMKTRATRQAEGPVAPTDSRRKVAGKGRSSLGTSSVTASSAAASSKPTAPVVRRDNRILFEDEYRPEAVAYMKEMEKITLPQVEVMNMQPELAWYMRPYLVEFLVEVHQQSRLRPEVLYLAINIIDRYVSKRIVFKKHYQLVGCSSLWIAAKFEDSKDKVPPLDVLRSMCCDAYDESAFLQMEGHILSTIGWTIGHPTSESWLRLACMGVTAEDAETQHVARFLMEISLFHKDFIPVLPSNIAKGALMLARYLLNKPRRFIDEKDPAVDAAFLIDTQLREHLADVSEVLITKYAPSYYGNASLFVQAQYLKGRRFEVQSLLPAALTARKVSAPANLMFPSRTSIINRSSGWPPHRTSVSSSGFSSPKQSLSSYSSDSDMPATPTFPVHNSTGPPFVRITSASSISSVASNLNLTSITSSTTERLPVGPGGMKQKGPGGNGFAVGESRKVLTTLNPQGSTQAVPVSLPPVPWPSHLVTRRFSG